MEEQINKQPISDCCKEKAICETNMASVGGEWQCVGTYNVCTKCNMICDPEWPDQI